jgi:hypothetical protein
MVVVVAILLTGVGCATNAPTEQVPHLAWYGVAPSFMR